MNKISFYIILFSALIATGCRQKPGQSSERIIFIQNEELKAGVLSGVGGRLVYLAPKGGRNLLEADTVQWFEPDGQIAVATPHAGFTAYNGHIIWPGPQADWWLKQEVNPDRREQNAVWPPDPYLIYSPYSILERRDSSILLQGPPSPVSGISFKKRYSLEGNSIKINVIMENTSSEPVAWDIWSNARFSGGTAFFVPWCDEGALLFASEDSKKSDRLDHILWKGAFSFLSAPPGPGKENRYAKAFLHPRKGRIVAVRDSTMLIMAFDFVSREDIHPDQGFVEIYQKITSDGAADLLELEHHSAYNELQPGECIELNESWELHKYKGTPELSSYLNIFYALSD